MSSPTYRLEELTRLTGFSARAVRYYVQRDLLPGPEQRGVATVYTHEQLLRLQALLVLRKRDRLRLTRAKKQLDGMSHPQIEALAALASRFTSPGAGTGATSATSATGPAAAVANVAVAPPSPLPGTSWHHVELLPGLELRVRSDASALVRRLAQEIFAQYAAGAAAGASGAPIAMDGAPD